MSALDARAFTVLDAARQLGEPYIWGGESLQEGGFDCSGFICHVLAGVGSVWPQVKVGRLTAEGLYRHFSGLGCKDITEETDLLPGCLVFFSQDKFSRIYHVKLHIATGVFGPLAIDAGGAGSNSPTLKAALRHAAGVRMSASTYHGGAFWRALDPFSLLED